MFKYYEKTYNLLQKYLPWCFKACGVLTIYHSTGLSCNSASMITPPGTPCIPSSICHGPSWLFCNRMLWPNNQYWIVYNTKLHRMADNYGRHTAVRSCVCVYVLCCVESGMIIYQYTDILVSTEWQNGQVRTGT